MPLLFEVFWFLLPAGTANLVPPIAAKFLPAWDTPIDLGKKFYGQALFGKTKTIRGFITGTLSATLVLNFQCSLAANYVFLKNLQLDEIFCKAWWLGFYLGFSALLGDLLKSFLKRRLNIPSGQPWFPWDQIDWIMGLLLFCYPIFKFSFAFIILALLLGLILSGSAKIIGFWFGINSHWY